MPNLMYRAGDCDGREQPQLTRFYLTSPEYSSRVVTVCIEHPKKIQNVIPIHSGAPRLNYPLRSKTAGLHRRLFSHCRLGAGGEFVTMDLGDEFFSGLSESGFAGIEVFRPKKANDAKARASSHSAQPSVASKKSRRETEGADSAAETKKKSLREKARELQEQAERLLAEAERASIDASGESEGERGDRDGGEGERDAPDGNAGKKKTQKKEKKKKKKKKKQGEVTTPCKASHCSSTIPPFRPLHSRPLRSRPSPPPETQLLEATSFLPTTPITPRHALPRAQADTTSANDAPTTPEERVDVSAWKPLLLHPSIEDAIAVLGFASPTPIQEAVIPLVTRDGRDVAGAAATGSGKTLAFALPILQGILEEREMRSASAAEASTR